MSDFRTRLRLRPSTAAHEVRDSESRDRGRDPDDRHLHAAPRRPPDRRPRLPPTDEEQGGRAHDEGDLDPEEDVLSDDDERDQRDEGPQDRGDAHQDRTLAGLGLLDRRQVELVGHHDLQPGFRLRGDLLHHLVELWPVEVPALEDVPDFLLLKVRKLDHLPSFSLDLGEVVVPARERGRVRDRAHRDGLREGRGEAARQDDRDRVRQVPRRDRPTAVAALPSLLTEVETPVGISRPEAVEAAIKAFRAKAPPLELVRAAARGVALHYDRASGVAPRSLAILGAAANLTTVMEPRDQILPVLQAIAYATSEKKPAAPAKPPLIVSGEVTHLGRSFLFAVRAGDVAEAESSFLGMVDEGWERKMAGAMVFRAALEDMGEGGRKLFLSVKSWQLARSLGS